MELIITFLRFSSDYHSALPYFIILFLFLSVLLFGFKLYHLLLQLRMNKNRTHGRTGEEVARIYFDQNDFKILDKQVHKNAHWKLNGVSQRFQLRPDFLIEKNNIKYLVEVKTGEAASIKNRNTRRQLREYSHEFSEYTPVLFNADLKHFLIVEF